MRAFLNTKTMSWFICWVDELMNWGVGEFNNYSIDELRSWLSIFWHADRRQEKRFLYLLGKLLLASYELMQAVRLSNISIGCVFYTVSRRYYFSLYSFLTKTRYNEVGLGWNFEEIVPRRFLDLLPDVPEENQAGIRSKAWKHKPC